MILVYSTSSILVTCVLENRKNFRILFIIYSEIHLSTTGGLIDKALGRFRAGSWKPYNFHKYSHLQKYYIHLEIP